MVDEYLDSKKKSRLNIIIMLYGTKVNCTNSVRVQTLKSSWLILNKKFLNKISNKRKMFSKSYKEM